MKFNNRNITLKTQLKKGEVFSIAIVFLVAMIIGLIINSEFLGIAIVNNVSMQDTLVEGDKLFVNKMAYRNDIPDRGDIVIFLKGETINGFFHRLTITSEDLFLRFSDEARENRLVKRVIGLPGDMVEFKNGRIFVDYLLLDEEYVKGVTNPYGMEDRFTIPEGVVFIMGDNREESLDSRRFGFVDIKSLEGRAVYRFWPFDRFIVFKQRYYD